MGIKTFLSYMVDFVLSLNPNLYYPRKLDLYNSNLSILFLINSLGKQSNRDRDGDLPTTGSFPKCS